MQPHCLCGARFSTKHQSTKCFFLPVECFKHPGTFHKSRDECATCTMERRHRARAAAAKAKAVADTEQKDERRRSRGSLSCPGRDRLLLICAYKLRLQTWRFIINFESMGARLVSRMSANLIIPCAWDRAGFRSSTWTMTEDADS